MKIGELSSLAGCSVPAVRFYEAEGLLQAPLRAANNYRQYGQQHVDRLAFIVRCRSLDMSHDDIRALLQLQDDPAMSCDEVNALLDDRSWWHSTVGRRRWLSSRAGLAAWRWWAG